MIGLAIALIVVGLVLLFVIPWVGIPVAVVGILLAVAIGLGLGRRAAARSGP